MSDPPANQATDRRRPDTQPDRRRPAGSRPDRRRPAGLALLCLVATAAAAQGPDDLPVRVAEAMRRATDAQQAGRFAGRVPGDPHHSEATAHPNGREPGFVWLAAFAVTNEPRYRDLALTRARDLAARQLQSGGWTDDETADLDRLYTREQYRRGEPMGSRTNRSSIGTSALPLRLLLEVAQVTDDAEVRAAAEYGVRAMVQAQRADGSWPLAMPPAPPVNVTDQGSTPTFELPPVWEQPTALQVAVLRTLLVAARLGDPVARESAVAAADRLLATQVVDPVPGWWDDYRPDGTPAVGFTSISTATVADVVEVLALCAVELEDARYLQPLPAVCEVLEAARLPDGQWPARLTPATWYYRPPELIVPRALAAARAALRHGGRPAPEPTRAERARLTADRLPAVLDLLASQHADGTWQLDVPAPSLADYIIGMRLLTDFLRDYEPLPDLPTDARPPQHRR